MIKTIKLLENELKRLQPGTRTGLIVVSGTLLDALVMEGKLSGYSSDVPDLTKIDIKGGIGGKKKITIHTLKDYPLLKVQLELKEGSELDSDGLNSFRIYLKDSQ